MRSLGQILALMLPLGLLLTWLLLRSTEPGRTERLAVQRALDMLAISETALNSDVLRARAGLLQEYDPLVHDVDELKRASAALQGIANGADAAEVAQIEVAVDATEELVEHFKSDNALLQNSLAYFDSITSRLETPDTPINLLPVTGALTSAMMHLTRDASGDVAAGVRSRIEALAQSTPPPESAADVASLVLHGRLLVNLLPDVDDILRRLPALSTAPERAVIGASSRERQTRLNARAERYRVALYLVALLLLAVLIRVGKQLRAGTLAVRERARFEHAVAEVSNSFLACQPEEIRSRLGPALAQIARACGAGRAYLLVPGDDPEIEQCSTPGLAALEGWPEALLGVVPGVLAAPGDVLATTERGAPPPGEVVALLQRFGVAKWACVKLVRDGVPAGLLCFDSWPERRALLRDTAGLLPLAGSVISNALQRERIARERAALEARLHRAQQLEAVGTLASGVAHNFNNVLGVMLGHAEIALDSSERQTATAQHVEKILVAGGRARQLVDQILEFGRTERGTRRLVAIGTLLNETLSLLRASLPNRLDTAIHEDTAQAWVMGEAAQLQQVLINLISNASQASAPESPVTVSAEVVAISGKRTLSHGSLPAGRYVRLCVADRGIGIDEATLAQLFRPFFTMRPGGTGLGLATAREVVAEAGGAFHVQSMPGEGSTFEVWLPVLPPRQAAEPQRGCGEVVMLVARDLPTVQRDEEMLAALDFEPVGYASAGAALAALRAAPDRFEAIVVESCLEDMPGLQLVAEMRRIVPRHPILMTAADGGRLGTAELSGLGVTEVLMRPLHSGTVAAALTRTLRSHAGAPRS